MAAKTFKIPDLTDKVVVITGGNAGLGAETVRRLAARNPREIFLCARTLSKAEALIAEIKQEHHVTITPISLDQSSLAGVRAGAEAILKATQKIDLLFLNAGIALTSPKLTVDGYEEQFGVNHISHALFTQLLLPTLLKTARADVQADVRIIVVASEAAHGFTRGAGINFSDVKTTMESYAVTTRYGQSKLANVLFAKKLAALYPSITTASLHPGMVKTEIQGKATGVGLLKLIWSPMEYLFGITVQEGAKTQLWVATGKDVKSGAYYQPFGKVITFPFEQDQKLTDELWTWTEEELKRVGGPGWPKED